MTRIGRPRLPCVPPPAQFVVPLAVAGALFGAPGGGPQAWDAGGEAHPVWLQNAGFLWVPFILLAAAARGSG